MACSLTQEKLRPGYWGHHCQGPEVELDELGIKSIKRALNERLHSVERQRILLLLHCYLRILSVEQQLTGPHTSREKEKEAGASSSPEVDDDDDVSHQRSAGD